MKQVSLVKQKLFGWQIALLAVPFFVVYLITHIVVLDTIAFVFWVIAIIVGIRNISGKRDGATKETGHNK